MAPTTAPARLPALLLALALAVGGMGCGGDDGASDRSGPDPTDAAPTGSGSGTESAAAEACRSVLDERNAGVAEAGRDASLDVVLWSRGAAPTAAEADIAAQAMAAWRDLLVADRERLAGADVDDEAAWEVVLGTVDAEVEVLDERIAAATAPDFEAAAAGLGVGRAPGEDVATALDDLGLVGRDCEVVATSAGTPPEDAAFVSEAAEACATIVTRRRTGTFGDDLDTVLGAVAAVTRGEDVDVDDALVEAVERVRAEWDTTHDDLAAVDGTVAPDPDAWAQVVRLAEQRAAGYARRAEAVTAGDQGDIATAFAPDVIGDPGFEGFEPNGLGQRDCRSVEA